MRNEEAVAVFGFDRHPFDFHAGLFQCVSGFLTVAGDAAGDDVIPGVLAAAETWHNVVDCKLAFPPAILADVAITVEDADTGELALGARPADDVLQLYDGRDSVGKS